MKKYIALPLLLAISLTSCGDFLDKEPVSDLAPGNFFQNTEEMSNWNAGIYTSFQTALNQRQVLFGDVRSDNCEKVQNYANTNYYMNSILPTDNGANWQNFYQVITRANTAIKMYPTIPGVTEAQLAPYMGQAYAMRAFMYFWGTRAWGRMPLVDAEFTGDLATISCPRASLDAVRDQIYSDIEAAISYFSLANSSGKFYMTMAGVRSLKVEADMWYGRYEDAITDSEWFVNNSDFSLAKNEKEWKGIFENPAASSEVIFAMHWDYASNGANNGWPGLLGASNTNNGWMLSQSLYNKFVDRLRCQDDNPEWGTDGRFWNTVDTVKLYYNAGRLPITYTMYDNMTTAAADRGITNCIKYSPEDPEKALDAALGIYKSQWKVLATTEADHKQVFMRLANIMLLRAEALNKMGRGDEALAIVNSIRSRVGYVKDANIDVDASDKDAVENLILDERQLEFFGEGQRWFDLMRTGKLVEVMDPVYRVRQEEAGVAVTGFGNEGTKYWPIYYREFESNTALKGDQNEPYTER